MIAVTKLISLLDKPSLVYWANKIGLDGVSLNEYRSKSTKKGTKKHVEVEEYIKNGKPFPESDLFEKAIKGFEILGCEVDVRNDFILGRIDLITKKNGLIYILDMKSSEKVYLSTKIQLSAYKHMYNADKIGVIDLNTFKVKILENTDTKKYYEIIKRLYQIQTILTELKEKL